MSMEKVKEENLKKVNWKGTICRKQKKEDKKKKQ